MVVVLVALTLLVTGVELVRWRTRPEARRLRMIRKITRQGRPLADGVPVEILTDD